MSHITTPVNASGSLSFSNKSISGRFQPDALSEFTSAPSPQWRASITFFARDAVFERGLTNRQSQPTAGGKRGPVSHFSRKSRTRFLLTARAVPGLRTFATITYGDDHPTDAQHIRSDWERLRKWLARRGLGGIWKREYQRRGAVHLHLLLNGDVDGNALRQQWARVSGNGSAFAVDVRPITDLERLCGYLAKDAGGAEGDEAGFRFWGTFGGVRLHVEEQIVGTLHDLAPLLRVARKLDDRFRDAAGLRARNDDGRRGCVLWNTAVALRKYLPALLTLFAIDKGAVSGEASPAPLPDTAEAKRCPGCKERRPREDFHHDAARSDGRHQYCRVCKNQRSAEQYKQNPFDTIAGNFNRKAARLGVEGKVTGDELAAVFQEASGVCARCGSPEKPHFDHARSFACKGPNTEENIQVLCQTCSLKKGRRCEDFRAAP